MPRRVNSISTASRRKKTTASIIELPAHGWQCWPFQKKLWSYAISGGKRAVVVWHRRAGKDLFALNYIAVASNQRPGLYWHVFPYLNQARRAIWEGYTSDGRKFIDYLPPELRADTNQNEMRITLRNGSTYQLVGADNKDKLVGSNPVGIVFSEYALMSPAMWDFLEPILQANNGWAMFISTPRGHNHFYKLHKYALTDPEWFTEILTVNHTTKADGSPIVTHEQIEGERRRGKMENIIQQEYYCSFDAPISGAYYADGITRAETDGRITILPYDPSLPVHTAWDLGVSDSTVIIFYQHNHLGGINIIDCYAASGEGLGHYAKILEQKPYRYGYHFAPHDIMVRELSGDGKSRYAIARSAGIHFRVAPRSPIADGIEAVRSLLPLCFFDAKKCERLIEALKTYRKEWDEDNQTFRSIPVHDWSSHYADAMRYLALSYKKPTNNNRPENIPQHRIL